LAPRCEKKDEEARSQISAKEKEEQKQGGACCSCRLEKEEKRTNPFLPDEEKVRKKREVSQKR